MKCKKLLSVALALCMVFGSAAFLPESTFIEYSGIRVSAETSDSFWYIELDDGTVQITGYKGNDSTLIIPSTINGKRVSSIGNGAFSECTDLSSVVFENANSIDEFGSYVFHGTKWLEEQKKRTH